MPVIGVWVKNAPNAPWLTLPFALNTDLKSSWTNDSRADDRMMYPGRIGNANLKYIVPYLSKKVCN